MQLGEQCQCSVGNFNILRISVMGKLWIVLKKQKTAFFKTYCRVLPLQENGFQKHVLHW